MFPGSLQAGHPVAVGQLPPAGFDPLHGRMNRDGAHEPVKKTLPIVGRHLVKRGREVIERIGPNLSAAARSAVKLTAEVVE